MGVLVRAVGLTLVVKKRGLLRIIWEFILRLLGCGR